MIYNDLVKKIAEQSGASQSTVDKVLKSFTSTVTETVKNGDSIALKGFLTFKPKTNSARTVRNPQTNEPIEIAERKSMSVVLGKKAKEILNEK